MEMTTGLPACFRPAARRGSVRRRRRPRAVDPQHHGLHLVVAAGLGQQIGQAVAAYGAGGLHAVHDMPLAVMRPTSSFAALGILLGEWRPGTLRPTPSSRDPRSPTSLITAWVISSGGELIHQAVVEGVAGGIATGLAQQLEEVILSARPHPGSISAARPRRCTWDCYSRSSQRWFASLARGHLYPGIGFDEGLVGADLGNTWGDVELPAPT